MSHDPHGAFDPSDGRPLLPATASVTKGVSLLVVLGVLCSIMQGTFVARSSPFGRVWPSANSAKIDLPPANLK